MKYDIVNHDTQVEMFAVKDGVTAITYSKQPYPSIGAFTASDEYKKMVREIDEMLEDYRQNGPEVING